MLDMYTTSQIWDTEQGTFFKREDLNSQGHALWYPINSQ